ncbi:MAG: class I SAM-dependent methyltransferase, partial [Ktedonobacteraceae bacterium]
VLEHIRVSDFPEIVKEIRRVLRPGGICSHRVDLKDHLGGALNNLRFPTRIWESNFMARSGFYTNRIRYSEIIQYFENAGFSVEVNNLEYFASLPTMRKHLAPEFCKFSDNELLISGFDVVLRPL